MPLMIERSPRIPPFPSRRPAHRERKALSQDANLRRAQLPPRLRCGSIHPFSPFTPAPSPSGRAVQSRTTRPEHPTRPSSIERPPGRTHGGTLNLGARDRRPRARPTAVHSATLSRTTIHTREKAEGTAHPQGHRPPYGPSLGSFLWAPCPRRRGLRAALHGDLGHLPKGTAECRMPVATNVLTGERNHRRSKKCPRFARDVRARDRDPTLEGPLGLGRLTLGTVRVGGSGGNNLPRLDGFGRGLHGCFPGQGHGREEKTRDQGESKKTLHGKPPHTKWKNCLCESTVGLFALFVKCCQRS
jgi:hypothetical protein